jgi:hypothetical protein
MLNHNILRQPPRKLPLPWLQRCITFLLPALQRRLLLQLKPLPGPTALPAAAATA